MKSKEFKKVICDVVKKQKDFLIVQNVELNIIMNSVEIKEIKKYETEFLERKFKLSSMLKKDIVKLY